MPKGACRWLKYDDGASRSARCCCLEHIVDANRAREPGIGAFYRWPSVGQRFAEVDAELEAVTALGEKLGGTLRLAATENAAATVLWPRLEKFPPLYPEIKIEIVVDVGLTDAGIRPGETVAQGMIATRIGPDMRMAVVRPRCVSL